MRHKTPSVRRRQVVTYLAQQLRAWLYISWAYHGGIVGFKLAFRPKGIKFDEAEPLLLSDCERDPNTGLAVGDAVRLDRGVGYTAARGGVSSLDRDSMGIWTLPLAEGRREPRTEADRINHLLRKGKCHIAGFVRLSGGASNGPGRVETLFCVLAYRWPESLGDTDWVILGELSEPFKPWTAQKAYLFWPPSLERVPEEPAEKLLPNTSTEALKTDLRTFCRELENGFPFCSKKEMQRRIRHLLSLHQIAFGGTGAVL